MYDIAYGNNMIVAVGASGKVFGGESGNGYVWRSRTTGISYNLTSIAYGNGLFVAVGESGIIITSLRSFSWSNKRINSAIIIQILSMQMVCL
jgi:hypothetical protein